VQRAPYSGREGKVGEGGRDVGTDNRFHALVSFLFMFRCGQVPPAITGPEIVKGGCGDFHPEQYPENFFHGFSAQLLFTVSATTGHRQK
jgi:hypothetical protein